MKKYTKYSFVILTILILGIIITFFCLKKDNKEISELEKIINISDVSEEFMDNYFEDMKELQENDNEENILIVTSLDELKDIYGATSVVSGPNHQYFLQYEDETSRKNALENFKNDENIYSANENTYYYLSELDDVNLDSTYNSWGIEKMGLDYASEYINDRKENATGIVNDITVAIIDSGCDMDLFNQSYSGKIVDTYNLYDSSDMYDDVGHGTHIAGTIAEGTPNNVKILPIKVSNSTSLSVAKIITAIDYITYYEKADVINMSFGSTDYIDTMYVAIEAAKSKKIISVAAAGNESTSTIDYPGGYDNTISISAVDSNFDIAYFSNYGSTIDFAAPGVSIVSINGTKSGTSMATPHAVSAVAILKSLYDYSFDETKTILRDYALDIGTSGKDDYYGYGFISLENIPFCESDDDGICEDESGVVKKIEVKSISTVAPYNFGTVSNLHKSELNIYFTDTNYYTKKFSELSDLVIEGYDPYSLTSQTITIKYQNKKVTVVVNNTASTMTAFTYETVDDDNIKITGYKQSLSSSDIPSTLMLPTKIDDKNVVEVSSGLYYAEKIIMPSSITKISDYAFKSNKYIKTITSTASQLEIGTQAFYLSSIENIDSSSSNIIVDNSAFYMTKIKTFTGKISSVGTLAFYNANLLETIELSNTIQTISNSAFNGCSSLENINLPESLTDIGNYALGGTKIKTLTIPSKITTIKEGTFKDCTSLETLNLNTNLLTIESSAFSGDNKIKNLNIPKNVISIADDAFSAAMFDTITVDSNNSVYNSNDNSNAIIETSTNTLIKGTATTVIPSYITKISSYAFNLNTNLTSIEVPSSVTEIQNAAFWGCTNLAKIFIPDSVVTFGTYVFNSKTTIRGNKTAAIKTYAEDNNLTFIDITPYIVEVNLNKKSYSAFDTVNSQNDIKEVYLWYYKWYYDDTTYKQGNYDEKITNGYTIKYIDDKDSFRYSDTYFILSGKNSFDKDYTKNVKVTVTKAIPTYTVPNNLTADYKDLLSSITLPDNFSWMDDTEEVTSSKNYKAKYTPSDTTNYEIVENIDIYISMNKATITPSISINNKTYDGTINIASDLIVISNLDSSDYTITSSVVDNANVGNRTATIKIKLTDEKFADFSFEGGVQEKIFNSSVVIDKKSLTKPTVTSKTYTYNKKEQTFALTGFDENSMIVSNNKRTNAGSQTVTVSLKNDNYIWSDQTNANLEYTFKIKKATPNIVYTVSSTNFAYDGKSHSISISITSPSNVSILYADKNDNYTLTKAPSYSDVGTYTIKYKLYIDDNYEEKYDSRIITISNSTIINNTTDFETVYDGQNHTIYVNVDANNYTVRYSKDGKSYDLTSAPKYKDVGEYTVYYKVMKSGYIDLVSSNKVKIYGIKSTTLDIKNNNVVITKLGSDIDDLKKKINSYGNINYIHYDKNNTVISNDILTTADKLQLKIKNSILAEYQIASLGDVNSDGKISSADYVKLRKHIMDIEVITSGVYFYAADINKDNKISSADYVKIRKYIMNGEGI